MLQSAGEQTLLPLEGKDNGMQAYSLSLLLQV